MTTRVWLCIIEHKYGSDITVHSSDDGALDHAYEYVKENWGEVFDTDEEPIPSDRREAVKSYFYERSERFAGSDEFLTIENRPLIYAGDGS